MPDRDFFFELSGWFVALLSCGFGNPIPEEILVMGAGIRMAQLGEYGVFRWLLLPVCMVGGVLADVVLYMLGRLFGARLFETRLMTRVAPPEKREHIRLNFDRYGIAIFVVGRLVPGIRTTLFLTAGSMRLSLVRFIIADGLGAMLGTASARRSRISSRTGKKRSSPTGPWYSSSPSSPSAATCSTASSATPSRPATPRKCPSSARRSLPPSQINMWLRRQPQ